MPPESGLGGLGFGVLGVRGSEFRVQGLGFRGSGLASGCVSPKLVTLKPTPKSAEPL